MSDPATGRTWPWAIVVAAFALALVAPVVTSGTFVNGDDSVLRIPLVSTWRNIPTIFSSDFMIYTEGLYRPVSFALLALVRSGVSADATVFWHAWLAGFHALNAVLVFLLASQFARRRVAAVVAGAVFAAHPMTALFANHMNAFRHTLGVALALGAMLSYLRYVTSKRITTYVLSLGLLAAGLLTSKLVLAVPAFLLLYEALSRRDGFGRVLARLLPVALCCAVVLPLWVLLQPHPMHFEAPTFRSTWARGSFYTFLGRTPFHLRAVVGGVGFEAPLNELGGRITGIAHPAFTHVLMWGALSAAVLAVAVFGLITRRWWSLGVLLAMLSVTPFSSVAFHRARDYISWQHLALTLAGMALFVGALVDAGLTLRRRAWRIIVLSAAAVLIAIYATMLVGANLRTRSTETYWRYVQTVNPKSGTASVAVGKVLLARGEVDAALEHLFTAAVGNTMESNFAMMFHYLDADEPLAAAVHFSHAVAWQPQEFHAGNRIQMVGAQLVYRAKMLDYVEQAMATLLMANPYDTAALRLMATVLADKGRVRAACMVATEAERIDPGDARTTRLLASLRERLYTAPAQSSPQVAVADYDWLVFVMRNTMTSRLREQVMGLAERYPSDPVLQFKAGVCLLDAGRTAEARAKLTAAGKRMSTHPEVRAVLKGLPPLAGGGDPDPVGQPRFLNDRGFMLFQEHRLSEAETCFRKAVETDPDFAVAHHNLAQTLRLQGKFDLALKHFRRVALLTPADPRAWESLAATLLSRGNDAECVRTLSEGLAATAGAPTVKLRLAWVLATSLDRAVRDGKRAVRLAASVGRADTSDDPHHLDVLAAAQAECGDFAGAVVTVRKAAEIARRLDRPVLLKTIEERRRTYERKQPTRLKPPGTRR